MEHDFRLYRGDGSKAEFLDTEELNYSTVSAEVKKRLLFFDVKDGKKK